MVIAAGPAMNILIAFVVLFVLALGLQRPTSLEVGTVEQGTPAAGALKPGDQIVSVDGAHPTNGGAQPSTGDLTDRADAIAKQVNSHTCAGGAKNDCHAHDAGDLRRQARRQARDGPDHPVLRRERPGDQRRRKGPLPGRVRAFRSGGFVDENRSVPGAAGWAVDTMWLTSPRGRCRPSPASSSPNSESRSPAWSVSARRRSTRRSASNAQEAFFVLAMISLSLGVINLFPFLPLDGGPHLLEPGREGPGTPGPVQRDRARERHRLPAHPAAVRVGLTNDGPSGALTIPA